MFRLLQDTGLLLKHPEHYPSSRMKLLAWRYIVILELFSLMEKRRLA